MAGTEGDRNIEHYMAITAAMSAIQARAAISQLPSGELKTNLRTEWRQWTIALEQRLPLDLSLRPLGDDP